MQSCVPAGVVLEETGFGYTMSLISGKYKMIILYCLSEYRVVRYNELKRLMGAVSHKMLSLSLKELEADGLIVRTEYPQLPPKVGYGHWRRDQSLIPILDALCEWGERHREPQRGEALAAERAESAGE